MAQMWRTWQKQQIWNTRCCCFVVSCALMFIHQQCMTFVRYHQIVLLYQVLTMPAVYLSDNLMKQNTFESFLSENYFCHKRVCGSAKYFRNSGKNRWKRVQKDCCRALCIFSHTGIAERLFSDNTDSLRKLSKKFTLHLDLTTPYWVTWLSSQTAVCLWPTGTTGGDRRCIWYTF